MLTLYVFLNYLFFKSGKLLMKKKHFADLQKKAQQVPQFFWVKGKL